VLCGDWNINLLVENNYRRTLQNRLLYNNLQNTVLCPTRVTSNTYSLLDVMTINKNYYDSTTRVMQMGYSDHSAVIMYILVNGPCVCIKKYSL
jgi:hypothetical protein